MVDNDAYIYTAPYEIKCTKFHEETFEEKIKVKEAPKNWSCDGTARVTVDIK